MASPEREPITGLWSVASSEIQGRDSGGGGGGKSLEAGGKHFKE